MACIFSFQLFTVKHFVIEVTAGQKHTKINAWNSEAEMLLKFGRDTLDKHIASGRILWRECRFTANVYEYSDQGHEWVENTTNRFKTIQKQQENEVAVGEEDDEFHQLWASISSGSHLEAMVDTPGTKGHAKGSSKGSGKTAKAKPKAKAALALKDKDAEGNGENEDPEDQEGGPKTEEDLMEECMGKLRKMKQMLSKSSDTIMEYQQQLKGHKNWTKAAQKEATGVSNDLEEGMNLISLIMCKKKKVASIEALKEHLVGTATAAKTAASLIKEMKHFLNRPASQAA